MFDNDIVNLTFDKDNLSYSEVNDECCIYLKNKGKAGILNKTSSCVFLFLLEKIEAGSSSVLVGEITEHLKSKYKVNEENVNLKNDIENLIIKFRENEILVK